MTKPKISIITVSYNCSHYIEKTILSVINQSYVNIEYNIIDGNSTDETLSIIYKYINSINFLVSENDQGIYDAMNKGIEHSTGEWLIFMNAGDVFYDSKTLENIFSQDQRMPKTIIYGNTIADYIDFTTLLKSRESSRVLSGMIGCHQSMFFSNDIFKLYKYNLKYKITADYELVVKCYINDIKFIKMDQCISKIDTTGISNIKTYDVIKSYILILKENNSLNFLNHCKLSLKLYRSFIRDQLLRIIPNNVVDVFRKLKYTWKKYK